MAEDSFALAGSAVMSCKSVPEVTLSAGSINYKQRKTGVILNKDRFKYKNQRCAALTFIMLHINTSTIFIY